METPDVKDSILTRDCSAFINHLHTTFNQQRQHLLALRQQRQQAIDAGKMPDFLEETKEIRDHEWQAAPGPKELSDRRVEITGPVERKMVINALNSGARVFMADFEDSHAPTWQNCLEGQQNLYDAVRGTIDYRNQKTGKEYTLNDNPAVLMVRPRGWHLEEVHYRIEEQPVSASIFDFGIFIFHNAKRLLDNGSGPYVYLPKIESYQEAQLWEQVMAESERFLGLPENCIKVTVLIETITAVFEMDEIIHALRNRITGLNCGRWDYIFSYIKKFRNHSEFVLPDREQVSMTTPFLDAYVRLLVYTCHRRGIHAMGGMAAQIPIKEDAQANEAALAKVTADKLREVKAGHDGTWVAHPGLVPLAMEIFNTYMPDPNQIKAHTTKPDISARELLAVPEGNISDESIRKNISVALHYLRSWLAGNGCVPVNFLMEDAATAEICRAQLWQWNRYAVRLTNNENVTPDLLRHALREESSRIEQSLTNKEQRHDLNQARQLLEGMIFDNKFVEFLTSEAYPLLNKNRS